jgi:hypothetical protein
MHPREIGGSIRRGVPYVRPAVAPMYWCRGTRRVGITEPLCVWRVAWSDGSTGARKQQGLPAVRSGESLHVTRP